VQPSLATDVFLPLALAIVMFGLGLKLTVQDFRRVAEQPKAVAIGLAVQMLVLPWVALALAWGLPPSLAMGMMLLAASPGGPTANLYSALAGGDVALNLTLTAVNSVLSAGWVPLVVGLSSWALLDEAQAVPLQTAKLVQVLVVVLLPVAAGMALRALRPAWSSRLERPVRLLSVGLLAALVLGLLAANAAALPEQLARCGLQVVAFNLMSLAAGWWLPRWAGLGDRQAVAISLEIGIHNGTLAIAVAHGVLGDLEAAIPAALYSLLAYATAAAVAWGASRTLARSPETGVE
jgi:BASS family bile acid:Na+ symporter